MKCNACGQEVPAGSAFCPGCGSSLTSDAAGASIAARLKPGSNRNPGNQPAEEDLWVGSYSPKAMAGPAIGLALLTVLGFVGASFAGPIGWTIAGIGAVVVWAFLAIVILYRTVTVHYRLTTFRLFHESGLLSRKRDRIEVIDINDVTLSQGIIERMFNVGTVHISSSDKTDPEFDMPGIENVRAVADLLDNTRRAERQRRAVFMENVGGSQPGLG
jgi:membrane protein YdbS with pleckstrin-like domain